MRTGEGEGIGERPVSMEWSQAVYCHRGGCSETERREGGRRV